TLQSQTKQLKELLISPPSTSQKIAQLFEHSLQPGEKCSVCYVERENNPGIVYAHSNIFKLGVTFHIICKECYKNLRKNACPECRSSYAERILSGVDPNVVEPELQKLQRILKAPLRSPLMNAFFTNRQVTRENALNVLSREEKAQLIFQTQKELLQVHWRK